MNAIQVVTIAAADFSEKAAQMMEEKIVHALSISQRCVLGLSGGSTPRPIYEVLGKSKKIEWANVWVYLADERYAPRDHPESNQKMLREIFLNHANIPEEQVLFPDTSLQLEECVLQYEMQLSNLFHAGPTDLLTLGMGEDGHTASLFPPLSDAAFSSHLVIHTQTDQFAVKDRISVTLPVLEQAKARLLLLGAKKKKIWEHLLEAKTDPKRWPIQALIDEKLTVLISN